MPAEGISSMPDLLYQWLDICWVLGQKEDLQKGTQLIQRDSCASS